MTESTICRISSAENSPPSRFFSMRDVKEGFSFL